MHKPSCNRFFFAHQLPSIKEKVNLPRIYRIGRKWIFFQHFRKRFKKTTEKKWQQACWGFLALDQAGKNKERWN